MRPVSYQQFRKRKAGARRFTAIEWLRFCRERQKKRPSKRSQKKKYQKYRREWEAAENIKREAMEAGEREIVEELFGQANRA